MKILFWNIGQKLTNNKLDLIKNIIVADNPDIICIAEGSHSKVNCKKLDNYFNLNNFTCYYSPLFYENQTLLLDYKYERLGLKIYLKDP